MSGSSKSELTLAGIQAAIRESLTVQEGGISFARIGDITRSTVRESVVVVWDSKLGDQLLPPFRRSINQPLSVSFIHGSLEANVRAWMTDGDIFGLFDGIGTTNNPIVLGGSDLLVFDKYIGYLVAARGLVAGLRNRREELTVVWNLAGMIFEMRNQDEPNPFAGLDLINLASLACLVSLLTMYSGENEALETRVIHSVGVQYSKGYLQPTTMIGGQAITEKVTLVPGRREIFFDPDALNWYSQERAPERRIAAAETVAKPEVIDKAKLDAVFASKIASGPRPTITVSESSNPPASSSNSLSSGSAAAISDSLNERSRTKPEDDESQLREPDQLELSEILVGLRNVEYGFATNAAFTSLLSRIARTRMADDDDVQVALNNAADAISLDIREQIKSRATLLKQAIFVYVESLNLQVKDLTTIAGFDVVRPEGIEIYGNYLVADVKGFEGALYRYDVIQLGNHIGSPGGYLTSRIGDEPIKETPSVLTFKWLSKHEQLVKKLSPEKLLERLTVLSEPLRQLLLKWRNDPLTITQMVDLF
jgi:hypothetical protein